MEVAILIVDYSKVSLEDELTARNKRLYDELKRSAKDRNIYFDLSLKDFSSLIDHNCYYCDAKPSNTYRSRRSHHLSIKYNGVDRTTNTKGYVADNVVTCCKTCNTAKSTMDEVDFIKWVSKVYKKAYVKEV